MPPPDPLSAALFKLFAETVGGQLLTADEFFEALEAAFGPPAKAKTREELEAEGWRELRSLGKREIPAAR